MSSRYYTIQGNPYPWKKIAQIAQESLGFKRNPKSNEDTALDIRQKHGISSSNPRLAIAAYVERLVDEGKVTAGRRLRIKRARTSGLAPKGYSIGAPHPDYRRDEGFYKSPAWRQIRLLALDNCRCCQACGARPPDVVLHVDHVIPRYKAPHLALTLSNLQILCEDCNLGKGAWSMADFREHFRSI